MGLVEHEEGGWYVEDGGNRLKALRGLLGHGSVESFDRAVQLRGLRAKVLKNIESPASTRVLFDYEAERIARAVGVPVSFFTAPPAMLGDMRLGEEAAAMPAEVAAAHEAAARALGATPSGSSPRARGEQPAQPREVDDPRPRRQRRA